MFTEEGDLLMEPTAASDKLAVGSMQVGPHSRVRCRLPCAVAGPAATAAATFGST